MEKSPTSLHFAAKLDSGDILIFDQDLKIINKIQSSLGVSGIYSKSEVVSNGRKLITCGKKGIEYWETSTSPCKLTEKTTKITSISSLALLPNNLLAAAGNTNGIIYILKDNGEIFHELKLRGMDMTLVLNLRKKMPDCIESLLYVEGSKELWAGDSDGNIHRSENFFISIIEGEHKRKDADYTLIRLNEVLHKGLGVYTLKERNIYKDIFSGGTNGVGLWGYDGSLLCHIVVEGMRNITSLSISQAYIIMGDGKGQIELWDATQDAQSRLTTFKPHQGGIVGIQTLIHSQDSQLCASGSYDGTIKLLNLHKGEVLRELKVANQVVGMTKIYIE